MPQPTDSEITETLMKWAEGFNHEGAIEFLHEIKDRIDIMMEAEEQALEDEQSEADQDGD